MGVGGAWWRVRAQFVTSGPQHTGHRHCGGLLVGAGGPVPIVSPEESTAGMLGFGVGGEGQELPNKPCREGCMGGMGYDVGPQRAPGWEGSGRYLGHTGGTWDISTGPRTN